jgi:hypothetical protein
VLPLANKYRISVWPIFRQEKVFSGPTGRAKNIIEKTLFETNALRVKSGRIEII